MSSRSLLAGFTRDMHTSQERKALLSQAPAAHRHVTRDEFDVLDQQSLSDATTLWYLAMLCYFAYAAGPKPAQTAC